MNAHKTHNAARMGRTRRLHFIGVGGAGMSGIAELMANLGYEVSGSDRRDSDVTRRLRGLGVDIHIGHAAGHVADADAVALSLNMAVNPEPEIANKAAKIDELETLDEDGEPLRRRRAHHVATEPEDDVPGL